MQTKVSLNTTCKILLNFNRGFSAHGQNWSFFQLSLFTHSWNPSKNEGEGKNTPPQICTILISETISFLLLLHINYHHHYHQIIMFWDIHIFCKPNERSSKMHYVMIDCSLTFVLDKYNYKAVLVNWSFSSIPWYRMNNKRVAHSYKTL